MNTFILHKAKFIYKTNGLQATANDCPLVHWVEKNIDIVMQQLIGSSNSEGPNSQNVAVMNTRPNSQDQDQQHKNKGKTKTKTTGSKQMHLAD